jgi:hypothetical protein
MLEFKSGAAVSVTTVPEVNVAVQVAPQSIPAGLEVTFPEPLPAFATVRLGSTFLANVAVQARATLIVTVAVVALPEQSPDQAAKVEVPSGAAVSVTEVPEGKLAVHVPPQSMPAGDDVTVPAPLPAWSPSVPRRSARRSRCSPCGCRA